MRQLIPKDYSGVISVKHKGKAIIEEVAGYAPRHLSRTFINFIKVTNAPRRKVKAVSRGRQGTFYPFQYLGCIYPNDVICYGKRS